MHSFLHSFIRSFIYSFIHLSIYSSTYRSINQFIHSFIYSFIHQTIHQCLPTFIHSFIHSFTDSFIHSFIYLIPGAGKTYTMLGTDEEPGIMVQALNDLFLVMKKNTTKAFKVTMSYLEVNHSRILFDSPLTLYVQLNLVIPPLVIPPLSLYHQ